MSFHENSSLYVNTFPSFTSLFSACIILRSYRFMFQTSRPACKKPPGFPWTVFQWSFVDKKIEPPFECRHRGFTLECKELPHADYNGGSIRTHPGM